MAETTRGESTRAIRSYLAHHPTASAQQVVDALRQDGITVRPGLVYNVKSYDAHRAGNPAPAPRRAAGPASDDASRGSKADAIRDMARQMRRPLRPRDVRRRLADRGIKVTRTQVSQVLGSMGMKQKGTLRRKTVASGGAVPRVAVGSDLLSIDDLLAAKKLVAQVGSIEKVREALAALARLS